jgi:hydrogenase maturation protease
MTGRILVAGIGNIFLGDDAFGSIVARRLLREKWPENVRVADFGISGMGLTFALLDGYQTVILIDAAPRGGAPGTVYMLEAPPVEGGAQVLDAHSMDPLRVLAAARSMGATWDRLLVVGCEPSPGMADPDGPGAVGMSPPVRRAVPEAARMVRRLVCGRNSVSSAG